MALAVRAPVDCEPLVALLPDQSPEAVQELALAEDHVRFEALPLATVLGLTSKMTLGLGGTTETVVV